MKRRFPILVAILAIALPALAADPLPAEKPPGEKPAPAPYVLEDPGPESPPEGVTERLRLRDQAQALYREERDSRRKAFLTAASEMSRPSDTSVPGWREDALRSPVEEPAPAAAPGSPLLLGRPFLLFAAVAGTLVFLLAASSRRKRKKREEPRPKKLPEGAMTVKLKPRETRWAELARKK